MISIEREIKWKIIRGKRKEEREGVTYQGIGDACVCGEVRGTSDTQRRSKNGLLVPLQGGTVDSENVCGCSTEEIRYLYNTVMLSMIP